MALLIAPLFTAGITVGGIQNANAGLIFDISCQFTEGTGTATVTLSLGEESSAFNKSISCVEENFNGGGPVNIDDVTQGAVVSCTNSVPTGTITPSLSNLIKSTNTASWDETITLNSDPGVTSFDCNIEFDVGGPDDTDDTLTQTVTINFVPPSLPIGGTVGSMDTVSLLVAGTQANMGWWIIALVGVVAGAGIVYKAKTNKTDKETQL